MIMPVCPECSLRSADCAEKCAALRLYKAEQSGKLLGEGLYKSSGKNTPSVAARQLPPRGSQDEGEGRATGAESSKSRNGRTGR